MVFARSARGGLVGVLAAVVALGLLLSGCPSAGGGGGGGGGDGGGGGGSVSLGSFAGPLLAYTDSSAYYIFVLAGPGFDFAPSGGFGSSEEPTSALVVYMRLSDAPAGPYGFVSYQGEGDGILSVFALKDYLVTYDESQNEIVEGRYFLGFSDSEFTSGGTVTINLTGESTLSLAFDLDLAEFNYQNEQFIDGPFAIAGSYSGPFEFVPYGVE